MSYWCDDRALYLEQRRLDARQQEAAIAIEAQRAVTTQIGTVRSTKARAESIAQTPIPSSRERK